MVGYAEKRKLGERPTDLLRNRRRSAQWYEQTAQSGMTEGDPGARLIASVEGADAQVDYEFADADSLRQQLPGLWQRLEPRLREAGVSGHAYLDFEDPQKRRWIEPVLVGQLFEVAHDYAVLERAKAAAPRATGQVSVRTATETDYGTILALLRAESFHHSTEPQDLATDLAKALWAGVVEASEGVVGFAQLAETDAVAHLEDLVVAEAQRGKGYGEALLVAALNWVAENRPGPVRLYTDFARTAAMALYKKHGFRQHHTGVTFQRPMDPTEIAEIMARRKNTYSRWVGFR